MLNNPVSSGLPDAEAGDVQEFNQSLDTARQTSSESYTKVKTCTVPRSGTYRVKFDLKCDDATQIAYGRIYKGATPHGTEQSQADATWTTKSEDLVFDALDEVNLYYKTSNAARDAHVRNFQLFTANPFNSQNTLD